MSGTNVIDLVDVTLDHPRGPAESGPAASDQRPLVAGASLGVASGEVVLVVGAAGVGTSRLVAAMLGEVPVSGGRIEILGRDVGKLRRSSLRLIRRRIGIVPQELCLLDDRSAQLNVVLPLEIDGIPREASLHRACQILSQLGLEAEATQPIDALSGAARQRVAVARAMVRDPELVVADHPTSMQDAAGAELVCTAIAIAAARGAGCIVLGRDPALLALADRHRWRKLGLIEGRLESLTEVSIDGRTLDEAFLESVPNVVQFPLAAGAGG